MIKGMLMECQTDSMGCLDVWMTVKMAFKLREGAPFTKNHRKDHGKQKNGAYSKASSFKVFHRMF